MMAIADTKTGPTAVLDQHRHGTRSSAVADAPRPVLELPRAMARHR